MFLPPLRFQEKAAVIGERREEGPTCSPLGSLVQSLVHFIDKLLFWSGAVRTSGGSVSGALAAWWVEISGVSATSSWPGCCHHPAAVCLFTWPCPHPLRTLPSPKTRESTTPVVLPKKSRYKSDKKPTSAYSVLFSTCFSFFLSFFPHFILSCSFLTEHIN